jgi:hypothetical protein
MKKIFISLTLVAIIANTYAQTLEHQYSGSYGQIYQVAENEFVYGLINQTLKQCMIYSMDHSLIKTINLIPDSATGFSIINLSKTLFNDDPKFEVFYHYAYMDNIWHHGFKEVNEDGTDLFAKYGSWECSFYNTNQGSKMILNSKDGSPLVEVYSLMGTVLESGEINSQTNSLLFPNPSKNKVTIIADIPENEQNLVLSVYSVNGQEVKEVSIRVKNKPIEINVSDLSPGVYLYRIRNNSYSTMMKRFVIE